MKKVFPRVPVDVRLILIGLVFFVNPNFSVLDVLPDFIGAAFILAGFLHLAQIDERAASAQKALLILTVTNIARTLSLLLLTGSSGTVWPLIFTFVFGIGEACLFAYGMIKLFAGIIYQAMRRNCAPVYTGFTALNGLTILVAVLKNLLCFLPELTGLVTDYGDVEAIAGNGAQISELIYTSLQILNGIVVTAYGIGWFLYMLKFFRTVGREKKFLADTEEVYMEEVGSKDEVLTYRSLKISGFLFFFALIFMIPLRLDGLDYLPDFAAGAFLIAAVWLLRSFEGKVKKRALIFGGCYTLLAAGEWVGQLLFNKSVVINYDIGYYDSMSTILLRYPEKLPVYFTIVGVGVVKYIFLALTLFFICRLFVPIIKDHTGTAYESDSEQSRLKSEKIKSDLEKFRKALIALSFLAAGAGIFYRAARMFSSLMFIEYTELAAVILLLAVFLVFLSKLREGIDNKYYLVKN